MMPLQIIGLTVGLLFIGSCIYLIVRKKQRLKNLWIWIVLGIGLSAISLNIEIVDILLKYFAMENRAYLIFSFTIILAYLLLLNISLKQEKIRKEISQLNQKIAVTHYKKKFKR